METQIIPTEQSTQLVEVQPIRHQAMAEFIALALAASTAESVNTRRAYTRAWGDFLIYVSDVWGLPRSLAIEEEVKRPDGKMTKKQWAYSGDTRIFAEIQPSLRDGYIQSMIDRDGDKKPLSRATRNQRKNAVNTLLRIAFRDGYISPDLARRLDVSPYKKRERRDEKPVGRRLDPGEVKRLRWAVTQAGNDPKCYRDTAILDLMLYAGLRRAEIAGYKDEEGKWKTPPLTPSSFRQDGGRWWMFVTGKGGKTRRVKVHDVLYRSLEAWAAHRGIALGEGDEPLFCNLTKGGNSTGNPLSASVIGRLVAEYSNKADLSPRHGGNRLSPHDLRRTFARNARDNGAPLEAVQKALGHSDIKTTMHYIGEHDNDNDTATDYVKY